jgi:phosphatidate cytidylyltransferase
MAHMSPAADGRPSSSALAERVVTAVVLIAGLLIVLFALPRAVAILALALVLLGAAWEWAGFLGAAPRSPWRVGYAAGMGVVMGLAWWAMALEGGLQRPVLWAGALWWAAALGWVCRFPTRIPVALIVCCGVLVLVPAWLALGRMLLGAEGPEWLLFVFLLVWAADIGAFFTGRALGRVRLAPRVSPGKTWEGVLGGLVLAGLAAVPGAWWFRQPPVAFVALCLAVALASVVGDLTVSMFKRHAGLKDSSDLLPGHGGILDRIDSMTAAAPLFVLGVGWLEAA